MTYEKLEDQIQGLLKAAAPLRELDPDSEDAAELPGIVDQINRLRAKQSSMTAAADLAALIAPKAVTIDRGALERRATDLGIKFHANIGDEKLAERVKEAMK
jgi:hypothetical protein